MTEQSTISYKIYEVVFGNRKLILALFALLTIVLGFQASQLKIDAGFAKNIPLEHEYMQTYMKHRQNFGGANRVLVSITTQEESIFNPEFFDVLEKVTAEIKSIPGIDQSQVSSLYTPNTRYIEVDEQGFRGGPVIDSDFRPTPEGLDKVRQNVLKANIVGRLVANDFKSAMVSAQLLEIDPTTREKLDYIQLANRLEEQIRGQFQTDEIDIQIIGFAKMIGDVSNGAKGVLLFFGIAIIITAILVFWYSKHWHLTVLPLLCSLIAVVWQLGLLTVLGYGIDPMSILVPFLVFAIGVSHGVQMINAIGRKVAQDRCNCTEAAGYAFRRLLIPGGIALLSDTLGFLTLLLIEIDIIRELAITASIGVAVIILTNLLLLPLMLCSVKVSDEYIEKVVDTRRKQDQIWQSISRVAKPSNAKVIIAIALVIAGFTYYESQRMKIGDLHAGAPALKPDSVYNQDTQFITDHYSIGVDMLSVIVETKKDACIDYSIMSQIDRFSWHMYNVQGVQSVISLPLVARNINAAYNEGHPDWLILSRNEAILSQSTGRVPTSTGLLSSACDIIPVLIFIEDHKAETIERIISAVKSFEAQNPPEGLSFNLASGPVGVMAATNEAVSEAQTPMLIWIYAAVIFLCLISFRSVRSTLCIVIPLALVSIMAQALMTWLEIGLTVATLPVIALGVGVGVDYGIYIFSRMSGFIKSGMPVAEAYFQTLQLTGNAVLFTGLTLAIGVSTWIFSALQFQADMGILLTFMFMVNMLAAIILLPALASVLYRQKD